MNEDGSAQVVGPRSAAAREGLIEPPTVEGAVLSDSAIRDGVDMASLIGRPHTFGRVKQLRNGLMIEPIATLTMQPDGRITGHGHPTEGGWIPYEHGEVDSSRAFAFVTAHNRAIPSSTWTQSIGPMAIGHFCDEPESDRAVQRLCLLPHRPSRDASDIVYVVASCQAFYERTIPALLPQLEAEGISSDRIKIVVNGSPRNEDRRIAGVDHAFSTHDAWECSALYEAPLRWRFGYAFMIHDTNTVFPGFRRSVEGFNRLFSWEHLPASPLARCLLGLYSYAFLMRLNPWLRQTDGMTKRQAVMAEAGAELLLRARSALVLSDLESNGAARAAEWRELVDHFNTGIPRVKRVFPAIKVHKFIHTGPDNPRAL